MFMIAHLTNLSKNKLESVQYNTALAITGAIRGSSREKLYQELGLESLKLRRWYRKLCLFFKLKKNKHPSYLFDMIPKVLSTRTTRNDNNPLFNVEHECFRNSFFPSTVIEWNKLDNNIRNSESVSAFKKQILKFIRPSANSTFNVHNPHGIKLLTRLRVGLSHLREHKFRHKIAKTFNSFFETVTDSLNLFSWPSKVNVCDDKVQGIIHNFSNHPSILKIKEKVQLNKRFSFQHVSEATVRKVVKDLPSDKVSAGEIPIKILKESTFCFPELTNCINESLTNNKFPDTLKLSDIKPVFKKLDPSDKANYRPVSILPLVSKVFEKIMYDQLYKYIVHFLNQLLCGFRKAHSTQHALFRLLQKWQKELDSGGFIGTILMDLSKAYDCLPHDLLIAKLEAYGLDNGSLNLLLDYLSFRKQRTKVGSAYSRWSNIRRGIPQGSVLGPLLFSIFINDIFMIIEQSDICNFADDNTLYSCGKSLTDIKENLVSDTLLTLYSKIEKIHHRTLKVIYQSNDTYENLLLQSNTVSVHQRHLRFLMIEIYKSISQLNPQFMWSFFTHKDIPYNLRKGPILGLPKTHSFYYGTNAIHFRGSLIWNNLPAVVKSSKSLFEFKNKIKNIGDIDCGCLICRDT